MYRRNDRYCQAVTTGTTVSHRWGCGVGRPCQSRSSGRDGEARRSGRRVCGRARGGDAVAV